MSESDNSTIAAGIDRGECDSCGTPLERGDLRCAICGKAAPVLNASVSNAEMIKILRCTGCGAMSEPTPFRWKALEAKVECDCLW